MNLPQKIQIYDIDILPFKTNNQLSLLITIHMTSLTLSIIQVTSSNIVALSLVLFNFLMLYIYLWCSFWNSDMFNLHYYCFFKESNLQKIRSIRIMDIILLLTKHITNRHQTRHAPFDSSIIYLFSFSPFHFFPPSIHSIHWLDFATQEVWWPTGDCTYGCDHQKTTCILAIGVSDCNHAQQLTSSAAIYHLSHNCNPSLLCCGDCLINFYWYLISI